MTQIEIYLDKDDYIKGFEVKGHTGYGARGQDIVCAAISVLSQTAVIGLEHFLTDKPQVVIDEGYLKCFLPASLSDEEREQAQVILQTVLLGLESTKASYNQYISINKRRWG